jgi:hypothetical protein
VRTGGESGGGGDHADGVDDVGGGLLPLLGQLGTEFAHSAAEFAMGDPDVGEDLGAGATQVVCDGVHPAGGEVGDIGQGTAYYVDQHETSLNDVRTEPVL